MLWNVVTITGSLNVQCTYHETSHFKYFAAADRPHMPHSRPQRRQCSQGAAEQTECCVLKEAYRCRW